MFNTYVIMTAWYINYIMHVCMDAICIKVKNKITHTSEMNYNTSPKFKAMEIIMVTEVALHYKQNKNKISNFRIMNICITCITIRIPG